MSDGFEIPRALSTGDDAYRDWAGLLLVFVDGVEQAYVTSYDLDAGVVHRLSLDGDGKLLPPVADAFLECEVRGHVEVVARAMISGVAKELARATS